MNKPRVINAGGTIGAVARQVRADYPESLLLWKETPSGNLRAEVYEQEKLVLIVTDKPDDTHK